MVYQLTQTFTQGVALFVERHPNISTAITDRFGVKFHRIWQYTAILKLIKREKLEIAPS